MEEFSKMDLIAFQINQNKKQSFKKYISLIICISFITASLLLTAFIFTHIYHEHDHNCSNGNCAVCTQILTAEYFLKFIFTGSICVSITLYFFCTIYSILKLIRFYNDFYTLVHLKIRLNN